MVPQVVLSFDISPLLMPARHRHCGCGGTVHCTAAAVSALGRRRRQCGHSGLRTPPVRTQPLSAPPGLTTGGQSCASCVRPADRHQCLADRRCPWHTDGLRSRTAMRTARRSTELRPELLAEAPLDGLSPHRTVRTPHSCGQTQVVRLLLSVRRTTELSADALEQGKISGQSCNCKCRSCNNYEIGNHSN